MQKEVSPGALPGFLLGLSPQTWIPGSRPCMGQALGIFYNLSSLSVPLGHHQEEEAISARAGLRSDLRGQAGWGGGGFLLLTNTRRCRAQTSPTAPFCSGPHTTSTVLCFRERVGKGNTWQGAQQRQRHDVWNPSLFEWGS